MNKVWNIIQTLIFCLFFAVGLGAISISILSQELIDYYHNEMYLAKTQLEIERKQAIAQDFDLQIGLIKNQPDVLQRLREVQFGEIPQNSEETFFPRENKALDQDAQAALTLTRSANTLTDKTPQWLTRINRKRERLILFTTGSLLILISFGCFGGVFACNINQKKKN